MEFVASITDVFNLIFVVACVSLFAMGYHKGGQR